MRGEGRKDKGDNNVCPRPGPAGKVSMLGPTNPTWHILSFGTRANDPLATLNAIASSVTAGDIPQIGIDDSSNKPLQHYGRNKAQQGMLNSRP